MVDVPAIDDTGESLGRKRSLGSGRRRPSRRDIELTWGLRKKVMASAGKNPQRIDVASHHESMDNRWIIISHY